ncbi:MAG: tRNA (guanosine(37)-N1)-methyltransferase TrmD [Candidatus Cloacimonetes bacterium]|nr:tRNA (guanosine(37)-N1)-methyltransferase TrmD [Candidatus Cloacimonadota bacterium]
MKIEVITLFPSIFEGFQSSSMVAKAIKNKALAMHCTDLREFALNKHRQADDYPYGGFAGMVMKPEPIWLCLQYLLEKGPAPVIYFTPQGRTLNQDILETYAREKRIILLCGHYKEIDQRVRNLAVSDDISIGDYVLSGGEIAAMVFIDGISRLQKGVLGDLDSAQTDSFQNGELGFPCWTRPDVFLGLKVPDVLRQGNHKLIQKWIAERSSELTKTRRPDLLSKT